MDDGAKRLTMSFLARHPDAAAAILEEQPVEMAGAFLSEIPARLGGPVVARMMPYQASRFLLEVGPRAAAVIVREMPLATAAMSLRHWPASKRDELLGNLPTRMALTVRLLLGYPRTTVGAWMDPRPALLPAEGTAGSALARIRREEGEMDRVLFVVDRDQKPEGRVRLNALLRAGENTPLSSILESVPDTLPARADLMEFRDHPAWDHADPVPVLSREGRIVGILRHADLRRALVAARVESNDSPGDSLVNLAGGSWLGLARVLDGLLRMIPAARPSAPPPEEKP